jgi:hypothetical protein
VTCIPTVKEAIVSMMTTFTNVTFVPGNRGALNAVVDGYIYTKNRSYREKDLTSPLPDHSHCSQETAIAVLMVCLILDGI